MKRRIVKVTSATAAVVTFLIGIWQFIAWYQEKSKANYGGEWKMTSEIESAQLERFKGLKIDWVLHLTQTHHKLTGIGEKIAENSIPLDYKARTTLSLEGSVEGDQFTLTFIEKGHLRETSGTFHGQFSNDKFQGTFSSTASDTKGNIIGYKAK